MRFQGNWNDGRQEIIVNLPMIQFEEDNCQILYCPALEVHGYGETESEAYESFKVSLSEFFKYTIRKGTFESEMIRLGWKIGKSKNKGFTPPTMKHLLDKNENFSRIFNNFPFKKFDKPVTFPAVA